MKKVFYSIPVLAILAACGQKATVEEKPAVPQSTVVAEPVTKTTAKRSGSAQRASGSGNYSIDNQSAARVPQKPQGISDAAKGAIIGGVAGAGAGAIIDRKKPARGAVIGGVVGAGTGYTIGRSSDRKSGRVEQGREYREYKRSQ